MSYKELTIDAVRRAEVLMVQAKEKGDMVLYFKLYKEVQLMKIQLTILE